MIGNRETNFPLKLSLTGEEVLNLCKVFANNPAMDLSKAQINVYSNNDISLYAGIMVNNIIKAFIKTWCN